MVAECEAQWETTPDLSPTSLESARGQLHDAQEFLHHVTSQQPLLSEVQGLARDMDLRASDSSQTSIQEAVSSVSDRLTRLQTQAGDKRDKLQVGNSHTNQSS